MKKEVYKKALQFYKNLRNAIRHDDTKYISRVIKEFKPLQGEISLKTLTTRTLEKARSEECGLITGSVLIEFSEACFSDLALLLRDPEAREIVKLFLDLSSTEDQDLYVHIRSVRCLGHEGVDGPALVTLVVDHYTGLEDAFDALSVREGSRICVHRSSGRE